MGEKLKLVEILEEVSKDLRNSNLNDTQITTIMEERYFTLLEISTSPLDLYKYRNTSDATWEFEDRLGNIIICIILPNNEFKSGYRVEVNGKEYTIFKPEDLAKQYQDLVKIGPDEKRVNTVYKILSDEVIPNFVLNKKPNKLQLNPVSKSRQKLTDIILTKLTKDYPQLKRNKNYLTYK